MPVFRAQLRTIGMTEAIVENQNWRDEIQKKLDDGRFFALEGEEILTSKDVLTAIDVIDALEASRDETDEWNHIKKLQRERSKRLAREEAIIE